MSYVKLGATIRGLVTSNTFADGSSVNADSTPTCVILQNGTAMGYAPTFVNKATGVYEVPIVVSVANGFAVGDACTVYAVVVVGGKTTHAPVAGVASFNVSAQDIDGTAILKPNSIVDKYVYGTSGGSLGKPTSWRVRVFATKAATDAATLGNTDSTDGEIERYKFTVTYNTSGTPATHKMDRDL